MIFENSSLKKRHRDGVEISRRRKRGLGISARGSDAAKAPQLVGDLTAGAPPVPIPNTEVKPRRADCTARESVWESRSLPALIKAVERNLDGLFLWVRLLSAFPIFQPTCDVCIHDPTRGKRSLASSCVENRAEATRNRRTHALRSCLG